MNRAIAYVWRVQGCKAVFEDARGQYIHDEGGRVYGVYFIPPTVGKRLFTDGIERTVYADDGGQFVYDGDGEKVYGVWILTDDERADEPLVVSPRE